MWCLGIFHVSVTGCIVLCIETIAQYRDGKLIAKVNDFFIGNSIIIIINYVDTFALSRQIAQAPIIHYMHPLA